ncbi:hypothetical protein PHK61_14140 [Actinomycetospora lutea]|uniref:hypothetical protein n=1 Tax=Actinomycetospora lutea TaxID=663604 RepID=UPI0023672EA1|nr:hypothetical protein [Actinomycetospora lutea]MDD7939559.1 hypothetical protein [Actinomycetospora lutea]
MEHPTEHTTGDVEETAREVLARLEELVAVTRRIDARLERLERREQRTWLPGDREPFPPDTEIGRPRRLTLTRTLTGAARAGAVDAVGRAGAT